MPPITSPSGSLGKERDPQTFLWMGKQSYDNNLKALDSVQFRRPAEVGDQYLDVGCGPGNFVAEALLPRLGHCRRLIATDKAASMVEYAREHYPNPAVVYDVLDIERGDVQSFVGKYGLFDRIYSFMAFHYVNDLERAYRNVFLALKDGGEFMTLSFTGTAITDVWYHLCCTEEWKAFLPNPKKVLYQRFCYSAPIPQTEIADNEGKAVAAAGLELVSCQVYDTYWTMPDIDSWLGESQTNQFWGINSHRASMHGFGLPYT
ncbi:hypothetical protein V5799_019596 [Amblyomma americanum]|uniref:Methyltransferase type 11 domain-containing protein n=1 Tax=Amblyomma americanum TaxID=6943 RepID=A0AAQ4EWS7_AMBAM